MVHAARRLTDQGRERHQQLLDAAEAVFTDRGYSSTRVTDICQRAGVAKGLFYWYFDTKEALFAELVRSIRQRLRRAQAAAMDPRADPVARIRQGSEASVRFMADHMSFFALVETQRSDAGIAPVLVESAVVYTADVERLIIEAQALGLIADDTDSALAAAGVLATVSSFSQSFRSGRLQTDIDELAAFVGAWVVRALGADMTTSRGRSQADLTTS